MISQQQAEEIELAPTGTTGKPGWRLVSMAELRKLYGTFLNFDNLHMPMSQYLGMMLDVVRVMTHYKGVATSTLPMDAWVYQEIIHERRPTVIIEIGNQCGGSTMMLRDLLFGNDITGAKRVFGIDIDRELMAPIAENWPDIHWMTADACDPKTAARVLDYLRPSDRVMVIDDSSHEYEKTLQVLKNFSPLVTKDQYFIVEDTLIGRYVPYKQNLYRAYDAVQDFLKTTKDFKIDRNREKWFITQNPEGFLLKIR